MPVANFTHAYGKLPDQVADLWLPSGGGHHPVVVLLHGGFWREPTRRDSADVLAADLVGHGFAVWNVEYRRVGHRGGGGGVPQTLHDVAAAAAALVELAGEWNLDLNRAAVAGFSAGGHLSLWLAGHAPAGLTLRLAVSVAGAVDLFESAERNLGNGATQDFCGGSPQAVPGNYDLADPASSLPLGVPQLLVHGDADVNVPIELSRGWLARAREAGDSCDLVELPGVDHFAVVQPGLPGWQAVLDRLAEITNPGVVSIGAALRWHAAAQPDRPAVTDDDRTLSRAELDDLSDRVATALHDQGVRQGDLVTLVLPNTVDFVVTCAALWKLGATPHPISPQAPAPEQDAMIEVAQPALVIRSPVIPAAARDRHDEVSPAWKASSTGGSTGRPKVVVSGSDGTIDPTKPTASFLPRDAVHLVVGPLHHSAPFTYAMRGLMLGHELVLLPRFDPARTLRAIQTHHVTWVLLVPTTMLRIHKLPTRDEYDVSSLETVLHLGAPCPVWLKRAWLDWLGPERLTEVYAGTESFGLTVIRGDEWLAHPGSVGRPGAGFEFAILDEAGTPVPTGGTGLVYAKPPRGTGSTYTYLGGTPERVGGFDTLGDLGWLDEQGYLFLADRSQDVILSGGENVYPAEVEAAIDEHPAVRSCAVIGLPDDDLGERVHAIVETAEPLKAELLQAYVAERVSAIKVPRTVEFVEEPVRDDAGKVRRSALRAARS